MEDGPNLSIVLIVLITFMAPAIPILFIGLIYYFKKKLEHREILTAIEKGLPVSELNLRSAKEADKSSGPGWIKDITSGITMLIIGGGLALVFPGFIRMMGSQTGVGVFNIFWIIPIVFLGNGIGHLIRGRMRRKYEQPVQSSDTDNLDNVSL